MSRQYRSYTKTFHCSPHCPLVRVNRGHKSIAHTYTESVADEFNDSIRNKASNNTNQTLFFGFYPIVSYLSVSLANSCSSALDEF